MRRVYNYSYLYDPVPDLVSIIIPTHNRAHYIIETLQSIEDQLYDKVEMIIVDDHSTDKTRDVVLEYADKSRFEIHYIASDGKGGNHARNMGLINSKGSYIQFFDDDDLMDREFLTARLNAMQSGLYDFSTCNFSYFEGVPSHIVGEKTISNIPHTVYSHLYHYSLPTPCFLFKRAAIEKIGFWNESVMRLQDMTYYHRLFKAGLNGIWLNRSLYLARKHESNLTKMISKDKMIHSWSEIYREWKSVDGASDVCILCVERMWDLISEERAKRHYWIWMKEMIVLAYKHPLTFFPMFAKKTYNRLKMCCGNLLGMLSY